MMMDLSNKMAIPIPDMLQNEHDEDSGAKKILMYGTKTDATTTPILLNDDGTIKISEVIAHADLTDMPDTGGTNTDHDTRYDARYLKLDGSNADSNINIGIYYFTATRINTNNWFDNSGVTQLISWNGSSEIDVYETVDFNTNNLFNVGTFTASSISDGTATLYAGDLTGLLSLVVDNITINGATIVSDTGDISFVNENLITTGRVEAENFHIQSGETYATILEADNTEHAADRTLTFDLSNADRTLKVYGNPELQDWFNQSVKTTASPTFNAPTISNMTVDNTQTDFYITAREISGSYDTFGVQGKKTNSHAIMEIYKNTATITGSCGYQCYGYGIPPTGANSNRELGSFYWDGTQYTITSTALGVGTLRALQLLTQGNTSQLYLNTDGSILMLPTYSVTVGGTNRDLYIDNTGKIGYVSSSQDYKKNVIDLDDSDRIYNLRPVKFDRIDGSSVGESGLIAEEANEVMPDIVSKRTNCIINKEKDWEGNDVDVKSWEETDIPESINYSRLIIPLLKEVQKLKLELENLKGRHN